MNLRLRPEQEEALRAESARTGTSQQELIRRAIDEILGTGGSPKRDELPDWVSPAAEPVRRVRSALKLPPGVTSDRLLDELRQERL